MKEKEEILEFHRLVVKGLVNGLSHTHTDGRTEEIDFWRKRSQLFGAFSRSVMNIITNQSYEYDETELVDIADEGYEKEGK